MIAPLLIRKGSIALDGISLTVAALEPRSFERDDHPAHVDADQPAPPPRRATVVNLEGDMLGKYVLRFAELAREAQAGAGA